jgi:hypothetical protein
MTPNADGVRGAAATHRGRRDAIRLFVAVVFVVGAAAVFSVVAVEDDVPPQTAFEDDRTDRFDRPASDDGLGRAPSGETWRSESGTWGISAGVARVVESTGTTNLASVDVGAGASVAAVVGGSGLCGVASAVDDNDFVGLIEVADLGVWNVFVSRNGERTSLARITPTPASISTNDRYVSLDVEPPVVTATVGIDRVSITVDDLPTGTRIGLLADGVATTCLFDDVVASRSAG